VGARWFVQVGALIFQTSRIALHERGSLSAVGGPVVSNILGASGVRGDTKGENERRRCWLMFVDR
jgi:hypothetical protein